MGGWQAISLTKRRLPPIVSDAAAAAAVTQAGKLKTNTFWQIMRSALANLLLMGFYCKSPWVHILKSGLPFEILNDSINVICPAFFWNSTQIKLMINFQSQLKDPEQKKMFGRSFFQRGDGDRFRWQIKILWSSKNVSQDKYTLAPSEYTDKPLSLIQIKNVISLANQNI